MAIKACGAAVLLQDLAGHFCRAKHVIPSRLSNDRAVGGRQADLPGEVLGAGDAVNAIVLSSEGDGPAEARGVQAALGRGVLVRQDAVRDHQVLALQVPRRAELQPLQDQGVAGTVT